MTRMYDIYFNLFKHLPPNISHKPIPNNANYLTIQKTCATTKTIPLFCIIGFANSINLIRRTTLNDLIRRTTINDNDVIL